MPATTHPQKSPLVKQADALVKGLGTGSAIQGTAYDTAWLASLPDSADRRSPRFALALSWLVERQHPDGSWGSLAPYPQDRVLSTLAALIPFARFGRRAEDRRRIRQGEHYLWKHAQELRFSPADLVGFELLLPAMVREARAAGIHVPPHLDSYEAEAQKKLALIPQEALYSPNVTVVHSLEFLGAAADMTRLPGAQGANGSVGNSPAATAFFLHLHEDERAEQYLRACQALTPDGAVPVLYPCETFEFLWTAFNLHLGGIRINGAVPEATWQSLARNLQGDGVSLSSTFPIPDADDTAVALVLLRSRRKTVVPDALKVFERPGHFVSFPYERHPSCGVNAHVLHALAMYPEYPGCSAAIAKILDYLEASQIGGVYWLDKWHISPYYATSHVIAALGQLRVQYAHRADQLLRQTLDWLLLTQNADGSWGSYGLATAEETAYGLLALAELEAAGRPVPLEAIRMAVTFLRQARTGERPALWIDKCLYAPPAIVESAILGALQRAQALRARASRPWSLGCQIDREVVA